MAVITHTITRRTNGRGTYCLTQEVAEALRQSGLREGTLTVFCQHTSCSLVIMENADPTARHDLHRFMDKLVPGDDPDYTHTLEGEDDAASHIKMALTRTSETIPFSRSQLLLGTWQGLYLWEHRDAPHHRRLILSIQGE